MRSRTIIYLLALAFVAVPLSLAKAEDAAAPAAAADKGKPAMDEAMMAKWKEASTPNENHKVLDPLVGSWNYTMKMWMAPDAPPEESTGTQTVEWIMGGRFIEKIVSGQSMGMPFSGKEITGYDNTKKEYQTVWLDNMSTGIMMSSGSFDAATKTVIKTVSQGKNFIYGLISCTY